VRLMTVENGRSVLRVANPGRSGTARPAGRFLPGHQTSRVLRRTAALRTLPLRQRRTPAFRREHERPPGDPGAGPDRNPYPGFPPSRSWSLRRPRLRRRHEPPPRTGSYPGWPPREWAGGAAGTDRSAAGRLRSRTDSTAAGTVGQLV